MQPTIRQTALTVITLAATTLLFGAPSSAEAACAVSAVERQLDARGISVEEVAVTTSADYGSLRLWNDGVATRLYVETDGDLTFKHWFGQTWNPNLRLANKINDEFKFISANTDADGDLEISYYVAHFDDDCPADIHKHAILWWNLLDGIRDFMRAQ